MNNTRNPIALQSQNAIMNALFALMKTTSYQDIRVVSICKTAGVDRRTFYRNFESLDDVLKQYIKCLGDEYITAYDKLLNKDRYNATVFFFDFWKEHASFILNIQHGGISEFVFASFKKFVFMNQSILITDEIEVDYLLAYRLGGYWNTMLTWIKHDTDISSLQLATILTKA